MVRNIQKRFINREIAWLSFNERVLQEAADISHPVIERVIFLGIFSNNMDEFFKVRVASLNRLIKNKKTGIEVIEAKEVLSQIKKIVDNQLIMFEKIFEWNVEELKKNHIHIVDEKQISEAQGKYIREYFCQYIRRHIYPVYVHKIENSIGLNDKSNFLAVSLSNSQNTKQKKEEMVIEIPVAHTNRFLVLPKKGTENYVILLDDVIRFCLDDIFNAVGFNYFESYTFKFIRDAELGLDDTGEDPATFVGILWQKLKERDTAKTVRLMHDKRMPTSLLSHLQSIFNVPKNEVFHSGGRYQNKKDFMNFPRHFKGKSLVYGNFRPQELKILPARVNSFEVLNKKDILIHLPYQSFQHIIDLVREASMDPQVISIKMTIYRVAKDSSIMNALLNAARNGKKVSVFMEVMARFDEEHNLDWSKRLKEEGVEVYPVIPGVKVHAKLIVICRQEKNKKRYYAAIGTGNPNEHTAKIYVDKYLLTANEKLTKEANQVFKTISKPLEDQTYKELILSPRKLRSSFEKLIDTEILNAKAGKQAWIKACFNNLADDRMVKKLYEAGQAGVKIQLIIRGICILRAGVKGLSENIEVISIVDRFLEHSRIYIFANGGIPKFYIGSADWMTRNLDRRIEVMAPIYDQTIQEDLLYCLNLQWADNTHARSLSDGKMNEYIRKGKKKIRSQELIFNFLKEKYS